LFSSTDDLIKFIERNQHAETRYCEFKGNVRWDSDIRFKIIRTILGLSNVRDGGYIIVGVVQNNSTNLFDIVGLDSSTAQTFDNDTISQMTNNFADTHAEINVKPFPYNDKTLVVIEVHQYGEVVICRQEHRDNDNKLVLENGAVYTRRYRKPETTKATSLEMREILEIVTEHRLRNVIRRLQSVGIIPSAQNIQVNEADETSFKQERADF